jgi:hypothetical protein
MSNSINNPTPQFGTAEYGGKPASNVCRLCQQPVGRTYYRVNASTVCPSCVEKVRPGMGIDDHAAFVRALAYGIGAAVVGLIGYAVIAILLYPWVISYMSIGVGWIVGTAMMKGSNGVGGRRYQIVAVLLTYAAISMAEIPIWIHFAPDRNQQKTAQEQKLEREQRMPGEQAEEAQPDSERTAERPQIGLGTWLARVLASPFIQLSGNALWGAIGLLILFWGMRIAWRITAGRFVISGPFADSAGTSS